MTSEGAFLIFSFFSYIKSNSTLHTPHSTPRFKLQTSNSPTYLLRHLRRKRIKNTENQRRRNDNLVVAPRNNVFASNSAKL